MFCFSISVIDKYFGAPLYYNFVPPTYSMTQWRDVDEEIGGM